jgi:hypothetical protein
MKKDKQQTAKFMPQLDGPYMVTNVNHTHSTVTLDLLHSSKIFPTFHMSQVVPFTENDATLFTLHKLEQSPPVIINDKEEYCVDQIQA